MIANVAQIFMLVMAFVNWNNNEVFAVYIAGSLVIGALGKRS